MAQRTVTWGDALAVEMFKTPGGLTHVVDAINDVMGPHYGSRNTFAKLMRVTDPEAMNPRDQWRAWLILTAIGESPTEWGLPDNLAPKFMDVQVLRENLVLAVRYGQIDSGNGLTAGYRSVTELGTYRSQRQLRQHAA